jgi:hypothetical protein
MSVLVDRRRRLMLPSLGLAFVAVLALALLAAAVFAPASGAHSERESFFPDPNAGKFPQYRTTGPKHVVCKRDSRDRILRMPAGALRDQNLQLLSQCRFRNIQEAVNAANNGHRILVLPGVYKELPSREPPTPECQGVYDQTASGNTAISYEDHRRCPNAQNLIAILGDTNGNRICDSKCNLQIEGTGAKPGDVTIRGERTKLNIIRADRADGIHIRNFWLELSDFNNIYVLETNGFRVSRVVSWYSREYGILSFTSDHGIYEDCDTAYNGDSGVYPGAGPDRHAQPDVHGHRYGIIIQRCNSHHNAMGHSGTAGNGIWVRNSRFHHNATGLVTDSFVPNHPGMPQDAAKWTNNLFYSNNNNLFTEERDDYCQNTPPAERDPKKVCPSFPLPVGTGILIAGGNANIIDSNYIFDNWRNGTMLFWVPAAVRGEDDSAKSHDTSGNNRHSRNCMGVRPSNLNNVDFSACSGSPDLNGTDFWWDEEEGRDCDPDQPGCVDTETQRGNCWSTNSGFGGFQPTSDPAALPPCPGNDTFRPSNSAKTASLVPCATWSPVDDPDTPVDENDPPGCDWFTTPPEPH